MKEQQPGWWSCQECGFNGFIGGKWGRLVHSCGRRGQFVIDWIWVGNPPEPEET